VLCGLLLFSLIAVNSSTSIYPTIYLIIIDN
jgi:hypothetical protein